MPSLHTAMETTTVTAPVWDGPNKNVLYFKRIAQLNYCLHLLVKIFKEKNYRGVQTQIQKV